MNKRKTRGGGGGGGPTRGERAGSGRAGSARTPDREPRDTPGKDGGAEGVYNNAR